MSEIGKKPNYLFYGFILISAGIHVLVLLHLAGIYESRTISYIELSMHQISKPDIRVIPKPRVRRKALKIPEINKFNVVGSKQDYSFEEIDLPELPENLDVSEFFVPDLIVPDSIVPDSIVPDSIVLGRAVQTPVANVEIPVATVEIPEDNIKFITAKEYFEMLNLKIYSVKKYPEFARSRHLEGRVKLEFVLSGAGLPFNVRIIKSSHHRSLDDAAVEAVKRASPFPRPPAFLFKLPVTLRITLLFELA